MDFPKKQAQRLMPLYLLEYSEKLFTNHPDPEAPWGGGSDYTAGEGITITNNVISVDDTIAKKSEIPTNYVTLDTEQTITGLKTIGQTSGTISEVDFSGFTFKLSNKAINHPEADVKIRNGSYDGYQHPIISSSKGLYVNLAKIRLGDDGNNTYGITMPDSSTWEADRVLATISDIPSLDGYATQTWVQEQGYATSNTLNEYIKNNDDTYTAVFKGKYAMVKPEEAQHVTIYGGGDINRVSPYGLPGYRYLFPEKNGTFAMLEDIPSLTGYATETWVENKGYVTSSSLATVATTGSYNDLTDKPTIPNTATSTSTSTVTPSTIELVFTYEDNTTQTITLMTGATVSTSTTTTLS